MCHLYIFPKFNYLYLHMCYSQFSFNFSLFYLFFLQMKLPWNQWQDATVEQLREQLDEAMGDQDRRWTWATNENSL